MRKIEQTQKPDNIKILLDFAHGKTGKIVFRDVVLTDLKKLKEAYQRYDLEFSNPILICETSMQVKDSAKILLKKYNSAKSIQSLQFIEQRRKHHNFVCCPFCGGSGQFTLDHYLPKEKGYGHFSVLSDNLIPCCSFCQNIKETKIPKTNTNRIIHPYFDNINQLVTLAIITTIDPIDILTSTFEFMTIPNIYNNGLHDAHCITYAEQLQNAHIELMELNTRIDIRRNLETAWRSIISGAAAEWEKNTTSAKAYVLQQGESLMKGHKSDDDVELLPISYKIALHIGILYDNKCLAAIDNNSIKQLTIPKTPSLFKKILQPLNI